MGISSREGGGAVGGMKGTGVVVVGQVARHEIGGGGRLLQGGDLGRPLLLQTGDGGMMMRAGPESLLVWERGKLTSL